MLQIYALRTGTLDLLEVRPNVPPPTDLLWVDLLRPTEQERAWVTRWFGDVLPSEQGISEIEASSRCYQEDSRTHVRSYLLHDRGDGLDTLTMAFVVADGRLFTVRPQDPLGWRTLLREAATTRGLVDDPFSLMLRVFEAQIDGLADMLEGLHKRLERLGKQVFEARSHDLEGLIDAVASERDVDDHVRLSLMDKERVLSYLLRRDLCPGAHLELLGEILRDVESLSAHSEFLYERLDALMAEVIGRVSIEQNRIIKLFSVAAVVLLPPTFIASVYGMNFLHMPELDWPLGYPFALLLMVASAIAPYQLFRHKGWL
jgi:magnesium transporter